MSPESAGLETVTLAVLAGGEGSRMGRAKGFIEIAGCPILDYLMDHLAWPGPTVLVTAPGREHPPGCARFSRECVDPVAGAGPMRGVLTALEDLSTPILVVITVDMPGIRPHHLQGLVAQAGASSQKVLGVMHSRCSAGRVEVEPFPAAFRPEAATAIRARLDSGKRSVRGLLEEPGFVAMPAPESWASDTWANLNSPADLESLARGGSRKG